MPKTKRIKVTKEDVSKFIMPNRCDICTVGIGTSMLFYENAWRPFKHYEPKVYIYYWSGGRLSLCKECYDNIVSSKDPDKYICPQLFATKTRYGEIKKALQKA